MKTMLVIGLLLLLSACSRLTLENYDKVKTGMTYDEVKSILGSANKCDELLGIKTCEWGNEEHKIVVNFVAGKVIFTSAENIH